MPNPGVMDQLVREHQGRLCLTARRSPAAEGLRVRVGHALIVLGARMSGERVERVERPAPSAALQTAC